MNAFRVNFCFLSVAVATLVGIRIFPLGSLKCKRLMESEGERKKMQFNIHFFHVMVICDIDFLDLMFKPENEFTKKKEYRAGNKQRIENHQHFRLTALKRYNFSLSLLFAS